MSPWLGLSTLISQQNHRTLTSSVGFHRHSRTLDDPLIGRAGSAGIFWKSDTDIPRLQYKNRWQDYSRIEPHTRLHLKHSLLDHLSLLMELQVWNNNDFLYIFERSFHSFHSSFIYLTKIFMKYYYYFKIPVLCEYILKSKLFLWSKLYFQHHYSSLQCHMIFRNHSNMLICCSRNISDYYQCWKQLHIFVETVIHFIFQDSLMTRKFKKQERNHLENHSFRTERWQKNTFSS